MHRSGHKRMSSAIDYDNLNSLRFITSQVDTLEADFNATAEKYFTSSTDSFQILIFE